MAEISSTLREALEAWLHWAENGAPEDGIFYRWAGVCFNISCYSREKRNSGIESYELRDLLISEFPDYEEQPYPFGLGDYVHRKAHNTQHQCPKRLAWVRGMLGLPHV